MLLEGELIILERYYPTYVENRGVLAVMKAALDHPHHRLQPLITVNDKNMSFDGEIILYSSGDWKKDTKKIKSVRIQVKGTSTKKIVKGSIKYSLSKKDLNIFLIEEGVLFFVVCIDKSKNEQIYFNALTPLEIRDIIRRMGTQDTISIDFWPLEENKLEAICLRFLKQQEKQPAILLRKSPPIADQMHIAEIGSTTYDPSSLSANNIFEHAILLYAKGEPANIPFAIGRVKSYTDPGHFILKTRSTPPVTLFIKRQTYEDKVIYNIEDVCLITQLKKPVKEGSYLRYEFEFLHFKSVHHQLQILPLLHNFFLGESLFIGEEELAGVHLNKRELDNFLEQIEFCLNSVQKAAECFHMLGIQLDKVITSEDITKVYYDLEFLSKVFLNQNYDNIRVIKPPIEPNDAAFTRLLVGDQYIGLYDMVNEQPRFVNAFSMEKLSVGATAHYEPTNEITSASVFAFLSLKDLTCCLNITFEKINFTIEHTDPFSDDFSKELHTKLAFSCIEAFDQTKNEGWLDTAMHIFQKYPNYNLEKGLVYDLDNDHIKFNAGPLSIRFRKKILSKEDFDYLEESKANRSLNDEPDIYFVIDILLGRIKDAERAFEKMSENQRETIENSPFYYLYKQMLDNQ